MTQANPSAISRLRALFSTLTLGASLALVFSLAARAEKVQQLKPTGYVNDFAGVLDAQSNARLTALCEEVDQKAQAQIAVVTVRTTEGVPIDEFSVDLATRWGIGPKKSDRGVLVLLAVGDHRYRVEVGYGLEPILPDGKVGGFGREMIPLLRAGDYGDALFLMTRRIGDVIAGDRGVTLSGQPPAIPRYAEERGPGGSVLPLWLFLFLFLGLPSIWWLLPLILGGFLGGGRRPRGWYGAGPWIGGGWSGGGWGGGGFGGGGFGGFGGGGFGGGGAGGSW